MPPSANSRRNCEADREEAHGNGGRQAAVGRQRQANCRGCHPFALPARWHTHLLLKGFCVVHPQTVLNARREASEVLVERYAQQLCQRFALLHGGQLCPPTLLPSTVRWWGGSRNLGGCRSSRGGDRGTGGVRERRGNVESKVEAQSASVYAAHRGSRAGRLALRWPPAPNRSPTPSGSCDGWATEQMKCYIGGDTAATEQKTDASSQYCWSSEAGLSGMSGGGQQ